MIFGRWFVCSAVFVLVSLEATAAGRSQDQQVPPLPDPLSLEQALRLADSKHPDLLIAEAAVQYARAKSQLVDSENGVKARVFARAQLIQPNEIAFDQSHNDSRLGLVVSKRLYDFGRSKGKVAASEAELQSREFLLVNARQAQQVKISELFFSVLLADMQFLRDNEDMSVKFVRMDRLRERNKLGQVSDLEVMQQEARYQQIRRQRYQSQNQQRLSRTRLAVALNRPGQPPSNLVPPDLKHLDRNLLEVEVLQEEAVRGNLAIKAVRASLEAARQRREAAEAEDGPVLTGRAEATAYARRSGSYDLWRLAVEIDYPLWDSGTADSEQARAQAEVFEYEGELANLEQEIRLAVLNLWLELDTLRIQREEMRSEVDYSDLFLDKSRALYEMEVRPNLGDAMTQVTDAQLNALQTDLRIELAWTELDALTGNLFIASDSVQSVDEQH